MLFVVFFFFFYFFVVSFIRHLPSLLFPSLLLLLLGVNFLLHPSSSFDSLTSDIIVPAFSVWRFWELCGFSFYGGGLCLLLFSDLFLVFFPFSSLGRLYRSFLFFLHMGMVGNSLIGWLVLVHRCTEQSSTQERAHGALYS